MSAWEFLRQRGDPELERPQHPVTIVRPFALGEYPVTRGEFAAFVRESNYTVLGDCIVHENHQFHSDSGATWRNPGFNQTDRDPVVCVNYEDAKAYIAWLNAKARDKPSVDRDSGPYYLPSEAEWEYAARAGTKTAYWWGDAIGKKNADCNACGSPWDGKRTAPVDSFPANRFGFHEMLGNIWERTEDCWHPNYKGAPADGSAWLDGGACTRRTIRGASWGNDPWQIRAANRSRCLPGDRGNFLGFRVARIAR
jgi:formylglycine-generating enzyme required for sulfatase activity